MGAIKVAGTSNIVRFAAAGFGDGGGERADDVVRDFRRRDNFNVVDTTNDGAARRDFRAGCGSVFGRDYLLHHFRVHVFAGRLLLADPHVAHVICL